MKRFYRMTQIIRQRTSYLRNDGIRLIATEGKGLFEILPQLGLIGGWLVVVYLVAFRVFRWE